MKKLTILAILILTAAAFAVPQYLTYQGVLRDSSGALVTGTKSMAFSIYNTSTGGSPVYGPQTETSVSVSNGNYSVQLGSITSPTTVFDGADKYLEVSVDGTALSPRLKINSVAYSIRAAAADTVATNAVSTAGIQDSAVTGAKIGAGTVTNANLEGNITGNKLASNATISTTGNITANTLFITKIATQGAGCVGKASIPNASPISAPIANPNIGDNSMIFVTPITEAAGLTYEALVPININSPIAGSFNVRTANRQNVSQEIFFNYLIIN